MATASTDRRSEDRLQVVLAALCAIVAFAGFSGTYWLQLPAGTFVGSPLLHLHGLLFFAWTLFIVSQAALIANRRILSHRAWGLAGIALATAMVFTGCAVAIAGLQDRVATGYAEAGSAFLIVPISSMALFAGFVAAAMVNRRRPEWHRRFMLVATAALLGAAFARFFFLAATGGGPGLRPGLNPPPPVEFAAVPILLADSIIGLAMLFDWRTRRRPHAAYLWGLGLLLVVQLSCVPVSKTESWSSFAGFLAHFAG